MAYSEVTKYYIHFAGTSDGYANYRVHITLYNGPEFLGYIRFHDPDMQFVEDAELNGIIHMNLPSTMVENVIEVLRHEKPIYYSFYNGTGFLSTSAEPVGEEEE